MLLRDSEGADRSSGATVESAEAGSARDSVGLTVDLPSCAPTAPPQSRCRRPVRPTSGLRRRWSRRPKSTGRSIPATALCRSRPPSARHAGDSHPSLNRAPPGRWASAGTAGGGASGMDRTCSSAGAPAPRGSRREAKNPASLGSAARDSSDKIVGHWYRSPGAQ